MHRLPAHQRGPHPLDAGRARHDLSRPHRDPSFRARRLQVRRAGRARVHDCGHPHAGVGEVERRGVRGVVGGEHDRLTADEHAVAMQVGPRGAGEHDARPVVVGEHDGPLVRAGRDEHAPGADAPDPLPRAVARREGTQVVGPPFQGQHESVVVVAERGGALQVQHVRGAGQFGGRRGDPLQSRGAVEAVGAAEQRAARLGLLVDERHPRPGSCRGERRGQAGRSRADHEQVGVRVRGVVAGGVG